MSAADEPVRDFTLNLNRPADPFGYQNARACQDISRASREELEDRFLRLHEENLLLKQQIHKQDDKIKKLGTKLMRLVKDRGRMEQLAAGGAQPVSRLRDVEMEEMMEELQEKVRGLQAENERLKQRLLVSKQQLLNSQSRRPSPYGHVQPRVNSGTNRLRDDASSPSHTRPKSTRSLEGAGRPPTGQLPRYGHSLLEEARAEIRNLENVVESQRSLMEQREAASENLREELRKKEEEFEERLLMVRQQQTSNVRSHVNSNVLMIKLQKQLADRSNTVTELEGRFLQIQESQRSLKLSHDAAMLKVDELSSQLKEERLKSLELENRLQRSVMSKKSVEQLQERLSELQQEKDLLQETNDRLLNSALDVSQQQKWFVQEQQLRLQVSQLEAALQADLVDKNQILDKIKTERDTNEKLTEENQKLRLQFMEQKQRLEELTHSRESEYDVDELAEALLLVKKRRCEQSSELSFLKLDAASGSQSSVAELRAAHAETIQELEKTRNLLSMESQICRDYKAELQAELRRMESERRESEHKLQHQAELLDGRAARIRKLEAQLRDIAYGTKTYGTKTYGTEAAVNEEEEEEEEELERGANLVELQIVSAVLSESALEVLGDGEPSTFCTYSFYRSDLHSTPVAAGQNPQYGFTSKYVVSMDQDFLDYLHRFSVSVEMHQALGLDWRTVATGKLQLQQLLDQNGKVHGTITLVGSCEEARCFGSVDYWMRFKMPMTQTLRLYKEKLKPISSSWNELMISVQRCSDLQSGSLQSGSQQPGSQQSGSQQSGSQQPSSYVVYKFFDFPDYPTATVHACRHPQFHDVKSYSVHMDEELDRYLKSEVLQFYVFDSEEEQTDVYLGKARVPLLPLSQNRSISGALQLIDSSGLPVGHLEVTLKWREAYFCPAGSITAGEEKHEEEEEPKLRPRTRLKDGPGTLPKDGPGTLPRDGPGTRLKDGPGTLLKDGPRDGPGTLPRDGPGTRLKDGPGTLLKDGPGTRLKDGPAAKKVTFIEAGDQTEARSSAAEKMEEEEEEEEEESHVSEGQLAASAQSCSDDSDVSEEIIEDVEEVPAAAEVQRESSQSDSDDCIVHGPAVGRKASDRVRVEVVSLSLRPDARVSRDASVVRLFVEYSFLDLPTEETPVSLPKPGPGKTINYNYSKVVPVDAETHGARRQLLRGILQGRNPAMERVRFTVVSEPPEEEEQDRECEDVGVAYLRIPEVLETHGDLLETSLPISGVEDSEVLGSLVVSLEGYDALLSIMKEAELQPLTSS
ncbi:protein fantom [Scomber japonicus]|uniref:protein fantom n=1 Tax=Scomber japonicus TaxID=13676 RepID=UPI002304E2B4|nr:protein fantom [Scomber japonicus]